MINIGDKLYNIIPCPNDIVLKSNKFEINRNTIIIAGEELNSSILFLHDFLNRTYNLDLVIINLNQARNKKNYIIIQLYEDLYKNPEEYHLIVDKEKITLEAPTERGIFYGIQTLIQMFYQISQNSNSPELNDIKLNCVEIHDEPRFKWRGFMLDEARHYFGKETVKKILDTMALLKLNTFHWHLTDDQGWRLEIKRYPRLTEVGSKRIGTVYVKNRVIINSGVSNRETDGVPVTGFYTQEDIKEIIDYAAKRHITIIPEIDLPGHTIALLTSYPELSCTGGPFEVGTQYGIYRDVLCIGKDIVFEFVEGIIGEVIDLFPSDCIHIGGDEAPRTRWKKCPDCQARMARKKIKSIDGLQVYFTNRISEYIMAHGKKVVTWNETIDMELNKEIYCQNWNAHNEQILNELKKDRKVIFSELEFNYFNYSYKHNSLKNAYQFEPIPKGLPKDYFANVMGIEACVWTEIIKTQEKLEWLLFPRLFATAEIGWTQNIKKNYQDFEKRLEILLRVFEKNGINFAIKEEYDGNPTKRAEKYLKGT